MHRTNPQGHQSGDVVGANMVDRYIGSAFDVVYEVYKNLENFPILIEFALTWIPRIEGIEDRNAEILERYENILIASEDAGTSASNAAESLRQTLEFAQQVAFNKEETEVFMQAAQSAASIATESAEQAESTVLQAVQDVVDGVDGQVERAEGYADRAEAASEAAFVNADVYPDVAAGLIGTAEGEQFQVLAASGDEFIRYRHDAGGVAYTEPGWTYPSNTLVRNIDQRTDELDSLDSPNVAFAVADDDNNASIAAYSDGTVEINKLVASQIETVDSVLESGRDAPSVVYGMADEDGNLPLALKNDGSVEIPSLVTAGITFNHHPEIPSNFALAFADDKGNVAMGIRRDGSFYPASNATESSDWKELSIGDDDTIVHIGDSFTAAHYVLKDKAYISQLSALSPFRHQNFGVSGDDALDMQYRIINKSSYRGATFEQMKPRYAFITSWENDRAFRAADRAFYAENIRRLVETVQAVGAEPVITTEFAATSTDVALLSRIADEYDCAFVDCSTIDAEIGGLNRGPFHQGHPGTRTGGVFWLPMLDFIDRLPKPERAIKIFRQRPGFVVASVDDLLYKDRISRHERWKELTIAHHSLANEEIYEELNKHTSWSWATNNDEYQALSRGEPVAFHDHALFEITLPGTAVTLDEVEIRLGVAGSAEIFVRNVLDVAASMPGKRQGSTPTDPTYLSKWDKPRGAWRSLGQHSATISIPKTDLSSAMVGDKLIVMAKGNFTLSSLRIRYKGGRTKLGKPLALKASAVGEDLMPQPLCGTSSQLADWTVAGTPELVVPIDIYNAPAKPGGNERVDGVCVISGENVIGQTVTLPEDGGLARKYRLTVWARYFPKAFFDASLYPDLDATQVVDRIANPEGTEITSNTTDLRTLHCEMWTGPETPETGAEFRDFAALQWRPIEFIYNAIPYRTGSSLSFRLSCPNGEIQVAKATLCEVI